MGEPFEPEVGDEVEFHPPGTGERLVDAIAAIARASEDANKWHREYRRADADRTALLDQRRLLGRELDRERKRRERLTMDRSKDRRESAILTGVATLVCVVLAAFIYAAVAGADNSGCADGKACVWRQTGFEGNKEVLGPNFGGNDWKALTFTAHSAKNRFGGRTLKLRGWPPEYQRCLNPGGEDDNTYPMTYWTLAKVGAAGSRC
jgi:hypothetical protein